MERRLRCHAKPHRDTRPKSCRKADGRNVRAVRKEEPSGDASCTQPQSPQRGHPLGSTDAETQAQDTCCLRSLQRPHPAGQTLRATLVMESRIHGDVYVRFGGRHLETYRRKAARRRVSSLQNGDQDMKKTIIVQLINVN